MLLLAGVDEPGMGVLVRPIRYERDAASRKLDGRKRKMLAVVDVSLYHGKMSCRVPLH